MSDKPYKRTENTDLLLEDEKVLVDNANWENVKVFILNERLKNTTVAVEKLEKKFDSSFVELKTEISKNNDKMEQLFDRHATSVNINIQGLSDRLKGYQEVADNKLKEIAGSQTSCQKEHGKLTSNHELRIQSLSTKQKIVIGIGSALGLAMLGAVVKYLFS